MKNRLESAARGALVLAVAVSAVTVAVLVRYSLPNGDDYCRARFLPLVPGIPGWHPVDDSFSYARESWLYWSGRWLANFIEPAVLSRADLLAIYPLIVLVTLGVLAACLFVTIRALYGTSVPDAGLACRCTLLLLLLLWAGTPAAGDAFLWFTGWVENVLPVALGAVVFALVGTAAAATGSRRIGYGILAGLGAFMVPGLHELFGVMLLLGLAAGAYLARHLGPRASGPWLACCTLAALSCTLVLAAPGNASRGSLFPEPDAINAIRITVLTLLRVMPGWILDPMFLAATAFFVLHPGVRAAQPSWAEALDRRGARWLLAVMPGVLVLLGFFGPVWALSNPTPLRTLNGVYLAFVLGWFAAVFILTRRFARTAEAHRPATALVALVAIVFAASIVLQGNTRTGLSDVRHAVLPWHAAMQARFETIQEAGESGGVIELDPVRIAPALLSPRDILEDPDHWRNACVAGYFGVQAVRVKASAGRGSVPGGR